MRWQYIRFSLAVYHSQLRAEYYYFGVIILVVFNNTSPISNLRFMSLDMVFLNSSVIFC